ncbi:MAG: NADH-quinone oxidoreductase subunit NuoH [Verrucomicrobiales bacterium]|nr:NADH-quinone oxidoreductase subunit NuoH [Verrucomicrobiales bacterium]MCP5528632.1 NADH-quinone oxidoreductase subunit NuoH [Verrucomicrobiales bacterium]
MNPTTEFILFSALKVVLVTIILLTIVAYTVYVERKVCAFIQDRVGPNRTGPFGLLQPLADAVKAFLKEDFVPGHVRKVYFWLAPAIVMVPSLVTIAVIPFGSTLGGQQMVLADLNIGILFTFAIVSLGVYGIVLAGYAANSKYPFMGGIRSSAQVISYEVAMGLSVIPVFMLVGDLNLSSVIGYQAQGWFGWLVFKQPVAFLLFLIAGFAETNRLPFDMPEAEQELAGGYNVEYGSIKFAMFFLGEYANMVAVSAMIVTLFLGGWTLPFYGLGEPATSFLVGLAHIGIFLAKMFAVLLFFIWVRWMLPRFRYDQLMDLGWKRFVPIALANVILTAIYLWLEA